MCTAMAHYLKCAPAKPGGWYRNCVGFTVEGAAVTYQM